MRRRPPRPRSPSHPRASKGVDCARVGRLEVVFECGTTWERMAGDGVRRFCDDCRRDVFDLDRLTPEEIRRRLEAGHGQFCGRLTRQAGRLAALPPLVPALVSLPSPRPRAAAVAAGLVTTWLSAASASARPAEPMTTLVSLPSGEDAGVRAPAPRPATLRGATLSGQVRDAEALALPGARVVARNLLDGAERTDYSGVDGGFELVDLPAGLYDLETTLPGFSPDVRRSIALDPGEALRADFDLALDTEMVVTVGALVAGPQPLRQLFDESRLVALVVVGESHIVDGGEPLEVETDLAIDSVLKGAVSNRRIGYRHAEYDADEEAEGWRADLEPGTRILAFLQPTDDEHARRPTFDAADNGYGIKRLDDAELAAYLDRIADLQRVERRAERRREIDPADLAEWLVATAEEPLTRGEAMDELLSGVEALQEHAAEIGTTLEGAAARLATLLHELRRAGGRPSDEPSAELLGAYIVADHRERLDAALAATDRLTDADLKLYSMVRHWDEASATGWLLERLRIADAAPADEETTWLLLWLVLDLESEEGEAVSEKILDRIEEIDELWPQGESEAVDARRAEAYLDLGAQVRGRLTELLGTSP